MAHLEGSDMRLARMDSATLLSGTHLSNNDDGSVFLADVRWNGANLAVIQWTPQNLNCLGDEIDARRSKTVNGKIKSKATRVLEWESAVRAYRQLTIVLRSSGMKLKPLIDLPIMLNCFNAKFSDVSLTMDGHFGSRILDLISGYGYKPMRSVTTYLIVIL